MFARNHGLIITQWVLAKILAAGFPCWHTLETPLKSNLNLVRFCCKSQRHTVIQMFNSQYWVFANQKYVSYQIPMAQTMSNT